MSDKKTLLEEGTIRRFMKLANMESLGSNFVNEMYGKAMKDDEDRPKKDDEARKDDDLDEGLGMRAKDDEERKDDDLDEGRGMRMKDDEERKDDDLDEGRGMRMKDDEERKDDDMREEVEIEEEIDIEEEMHGGSMADDEEMDLDVKDEEEEMDMDAGDMGELTLTDEEAEVFLKVADKVRAAMEMDAPEEVPAPDMGAMDDPVDGMDMEDKPMMEDMVNEIARRVAKRLKGLKESE